MIPKNKIFILLVLTIQLQLGICKAHEGFIKICLPGLLYMTNVTHIF